MNTEHAPLWGVYISGPDEATLKALEGQCRQRAKDFLNFTNGPAHVWKDAIDESGADRPDREAMLESARNGEFQYLITPSPVGLSTVFWRYESIKNQLRENDVKLHLLDGCPDGSTQGASTMHTDSYPGLPLCRRIFQLAADGASPCDIAATLNRDEPSSE